ncbi:hypothetical protein F3J14_01655 [Burkholderia sp. Tr-862]|uniref:hypothetical protein n=1 Tax=Burkholderia sp. Tr-862 TaxID=2608331 RepID=UPI001419D152|nr:hypothetical protein [Burkholderia sp. Tr-862]NIF39630.1 hypothetical protein [Burkholderia sp. Tr-862]
MNRTGNPRCVLIEKDDGRFAADRYRALARREIDARSTRTAHRPAAHADRNGTAALCRAVRRAASGFGRNRGRDFLSPSPKKASE